MAKSSIVINLFDGKPKNLVLWKRESDGNLSWKYIKTHSAIGKSPSLDTIKAFYTAIGVPTYTFDLQKRKFVG